MDFCTILTIPESVEKKGTVVKRKPAEGFHCNRIRF